MKRITTFNDAIARLRLNGRLRVSASLRLVLLITLAATACSIPNLATPECAEAKPAVREFYSFHFGNDMTYTKENLAAREKFITPRFRDEIAARQITAGDPFTVNNDDLPRAFRVGECRTISADRVSFDVLVFWKDDARTDQKTVRIEAQKVGDDWLIDKVSN